ncbi:MAG: S9 family peptidase [candidate division Zixibacteria bacterium]|nr:S9 family peptidase [candidate division Zixibacteria bacterium]
MNNLSHKSYINLKNIVLFAAVAIFAAIISSCTVTEIPKPPVAKIEAKVDTSFGDIRTDNYFWLRQRGDSAVIAYLEEENAYTEAMMKHTESKQEDLYEELVGRIKETDEDVPVKEDDYFYYSRTEEGQQYKIYCRKKGSLDADEEIILNVNIIAEGHEYCAVGVYEISPSHQLLAYSIDTSGSETYDLYVKDLNTGKLYDDVIPNTSSTAEWGNDNQNIFYTIDDEARRPYKLFRHRLGDSLENDLLIYTETDEKFFLYIAKTKSKKYLLQYSESITTTEIHFLDADNPTGEFKIIHPRQQDMEYDVAHHGTDFYVKTNEKAKNFKLMKTPVRSPAKSNWREVIPHRKAVKIENVEVFENHVVIYERENGLENIRILNLQTGDDHHIEFPEPVYGLRTQSNPEFESDKLRFMYYSMVTPKTIFDYNMNSKDRELKKEYEVIGYDKSLYETKRIFAEAKDGTQIPISIVYKKDFRQDGTRPLYLYGYGSYGASMEPSFSSNRISYLDRGFAYAIAHIRGGSEMGRYWYDEGKLLNKKNTFTDFIACAEHLIERGYTSKDKLVISGGSAGGLLMGAVLNMRPDLFEVAVADVPFVDVINTMLDESIPLTVTEYEEWGNPHDSVFYTYMKSYSPYDNVGAKEYPHLLITAGLNDPRVQYWEPAKWTAKLRANNLGDNWLLLKTNMGAGHGGASGRYDYLKDVAFRMAFIFDRLDIN